MSTEIEIELVETELNLLSAINSGDVEGVLRHMHPQWDSFWPGGLKLFNSAMGREGIRDTFTTGFSFNFHFHELEIKIYDNTSIATGYLIGTATEPDGIDSDVNWRVSIVRIHQDGAWKVIHWHESALVLD